MQEASVEGGMAAREGEDSSGLTAAVTRSILPFQEDKYGGAKEEARTFGGCCGFRRADSMGVSESQRDALATPTSQPNQEGESRWLPAQNDGKRQRAVIR